jgi:hypothetical protein
MPHVNAKLNALFGFLVLPVPATEACVVFGKIVVVEESLMFTAAGEYSRYIWRFFFPTCGAAAQRGPWPPHS